MRILLSTIMVAFASFVGAKTTFTSQDMEQLLQRMTLEEKIGQMLQLNIDGLGKGKGDDFILDEEKLHEAIAVYKVGSILNTPGPVAMSTKRWQELVSRIQEVSMKEIGSPYTRIWQPNLHGPQHL